jgi:hypothetical protein
MAIQQHHSYSQILKLVKSCQTWAEFNLKYPSIYDYANSKKWGYSLRVDSGVRHRFYYKWMTDQQLIELGSEYHNLTELTNHNGALTAELYRRKLTRQLPYQFKGEGNVRQFTYDICKKAVSEVSSRQELYETNKPVWNAIYRYGWKDLFNESHNIYTPSNVLYIWNSLEYSNLWKVGVSNNLLVLGGFRWENRVKCVAREGNLTPDTIYHTITDNPSTIEKKILSEYPKYNWDVKFDGSNEFVELTKTQFESIINNYFSTCNQLTAARATVP